MQRWGAKKPRRRSAHFAIFAPWASSSCFVPNGTTLDVPLDRERITIGRRADNDVCLPYPAVSGEHAVVVTILADSFLEDLGSTNGTLVNGKPIAKHFLRDRDQIDIGRHMLLYFVDDDAIPPAGILKKAIREARRRPGRQGRDRQAYRADPAGEPGGRAAGRREAGGAGQGRGVDPEDRRVAANPLAARLPDARRRRRLPTLKFLSGARAGQAVALTHERTTIGRAGVQVVAIERSGDGFPPEAGRGRAAPVNGRPASEDGVAAGSRATSSRSSATGWSSSAPAEPRPARQAEIRRAARQVARTAA